MSKLIDTFTIPVIHSNQIQVKYVTGVAGQSGITDGICVDTGLSAVININGIEFLCSIGDIGKQDAGSFKQHLTEPVCSICRSNMEHFGVYYGRRTGFFDWTANGKIDFWKFRMNVNDHQDPTLKIICDKCHSHIISKLNRYVEDNYESLIIETL
jgi:hypothetical protein